jgi:hypothetical protein
MLQQSGLDIDRELFEQFPHGFDDEAFLLVMLVYIENKEENIYS